MLYIISIMKPTRSAVLLERKIETVRQQVAALGPMHPGSLSQQYQVCGRAGCRCMDSAQPERHGPYTKLAYVHRGKPVCRFVRAACVAEVRQRLAVYKTFRKLLDRWIELSIRQGQAEFFSRPIAAKAKAASSHSGSNSRQKNRIP